MESRYYKIIHEDNFEKYACYDLSIHWNVEEIAGKSNANGFIVQEVDIKNTTSIKGLSDIAYYEAWKVENGNFIYHCEKEPDDSFAWGNWCCKSMMTNSINKKGTITYKSKVFWVDRDSKLFVLIEKWKEETVFEAGKLKSVYKNDCNEFIHEYPVFIRPDFIHYVDFTEWKDIKEAIINGYKKCTPQKTKLFEWAKDILEDTDYEKNIREFEE